MKDLQIENNNIAETTVFPLDDVFPFFTEHIDIPNNERIFFSGKFGIGKTHFLKEYFKEHSDKYEVFHLFPVNYQISSNEDVIELLKYDILTTLLNKDESILETKDYSGISDLSTMIYLWGAENFKDIFKTAVSYIPRLGKPLKEVIGFYESFSTFKEQLKNPELDTVTNFLSSLKDRNIQETDLISELLRDKIFGLKNEKESVLILDDLDRMDPEHIFRILNVFSSQFDIQNKQTNKFGFDKIIIVADYNNIKSIFSHKYGSNTDFSGYLDKFFSTEVFEFSNEKIIPYIAKHFTLQFTKLNQDPVLNELVENLIESISIDTKEIINKEDIIVREIIKRLQLNLEADFNSILESKINNPTSTALKIGILIFTKTFGSETNFINQITNFKNLSDRTSNPQFNIYSQSLLAKLDQNYIKTLPSLKWGNYYITLNNGHISKVQTNTNRNDCSLSVFYSLLNSYIVGKHHLKS